MFLYLNPPRVFWAINDSNIRLTRSNPFYEVTDEEYESLTEEQRGVLDLSLQAAIIEKINSKFVPKNGVNTTVEYILSRPTSEIQRKYISRMVMAEDTDSLESLKKKEQESNTPRENVIFLVDKGLERVRKKNLLGSTEKVEFAFDDFEEEALKDVSKETK